MKVNVSLINTEYFAVRVHVFPFSFVFCFSFGVKMVCYIYYLLYYVDSYILASNLHNSLSEFLVKACNVMSVTILEVHEMCIVHC